MKINDFNFAGKKAIVRVDFNVPLDKDMLQMKQEFAVHFLHLKRY